MSLLEMSEVVKKVLNVGNVSPKLLQTQVTFRFGVGRRSSLLRRACDEQDIAQYCACNNRRIKFRTEFKFKFKPYISVQS